MLDNFLIDFLLFYAIKYSCPKKLFVNVLSSEPLATPLKNKVELEKTNSVPEKAPLFFTYDKIFDMKQKRLNDHKLSKVEPPLKRPRGLQKRKQKQKEN